MIVSVMKTLTNRLGLFDEAKRNDLVERWIDRLRIKVRSPDNPVRELSGGNQQRVVLAKWLATQPKVLILDSPTVGVDIGAKAGIHDVIDELARNQLAILFISDETQEVLHHPIAFS